MASSEELTAMEKELFKYTTNCNYDEVKRLLTLDKVPVNCFDEDGLTPLQHAAFKGDYILCKLLLDNGADVNLIRHTSQYSALTFAGLSGKIDVVRLLLEHGASTSKVKSIHKTAAQMAAFFGNHDVVSVINNFIPIEKVAEVVYKFERMPSLCAPIHRMAIKTNIHPVRLVMYLKENIRMIECSKIVIKDLKIISEKQLKEEGNEFLSLRFHHLAFIITACESFISKHYVKIFAGESNLFDALTKLIKIWIKGDKNGFPVVLEKLLRQDIREYPYHECSLFQEIVRTVAPVKIGEDCSAITIINQALNGQQGVDAFTCCATCGEPSADKKCSICRSIYYCNKYCQKLHWFTHKVMCPTLMKKYQELEKKAD